MNVRPLLLILAISLAAPSVANAQSFEFRLNDEGEWVQVAAPEEGSDAAEIASARRDLAEDRPRSAKATLDDWIKANDGIRTDLLGQALRLRGDAKTALGNEYLALYDYERVIKEYSNSPEYVLAVERELDIGIRYVFGLRRRTLGMRLFDSASIGEELLVRVQERMPGSVLAERAGIELADYYYRIRDLRLASEAYDLFLLNHPRSEFVKHAMRRRIYATIGQFKGPAYDGSTLTDARVLIERYRTLYPEDARLEGLDGSLLTRLDESAAAEILLTGSWYLARGENIAAKYVFERLLEAYPGTAAANNALATLEERGWRLGPAPVGAAMSETPVSEGAEDALADEAIDDEIDDALDEVEDEVLEDAVIDEPDPEAPEPQP